MGKTLQSLQKGIPGCCSLCICVCKCVWVPISFILLVLLTQKFLFWQYAHFSDHNWLIGGQMSEVIWTERGERTCSLGTGVQMPLLWERRTFFCHRTEGTLRGFPQPFPPPRENQWPFCSSCWCLSSLGLETSHKGQSSLPAPHYP